MADVIRLHPCNRAILLRLRGVLHLTFSLFSSTLVSALLLLSPHLTALSDEAKPSATKPDLAAADQLFRAGKFADAEASYRAILKTDLNLVPAQVGLVRAVLRQQKLDEALDTVNAALVVQPNVAALLAAKGDVQFRLGEMHDAELSYLRARKADPKEAHAYLGLAQLYRSYSLYRTAFDHY